MKKSVILFSALMLLAFGNAVLAQDDSDDLERDVLEIALFGGLDSPTGQMLEWKDTLGAKVGYNFGFDVGYFISEPFVAGFGFRFSEYSIHTSEADLVAGDLKHRSYNPHLYMKYSFMPMNTISPYIKANVGLTFFKFTTWVQNVNGDRYRQISYDPALSFGFGGGVFLYTADYGGFYVEGNYHIIRSSDVDAEYEGNTYDFGDNLAAFDVRAGVRILIGSGD